MNEVMSTLGSGLQKKYSPLAEIFVPFACVSLLPDFLQTFLDRLEQMGLEDKINVTTLLYKIRGRIPCHVYRQWSLVILGQSHGEFPS